MLAIVPVCGQLRISSEESQCASAYCICRIDWRTAVNLEEAAKLSHSDWQQRDANFSE
jgi:hypothetical protein